MNRKVCLNRRPDVVHHSGINSSPGNPFIHVIIPAIKCNLYRSRGMLPEKLNPLIIQEQSVRQDADLTSNAVEIMEQFFKSGICQAFPAGQIRRQHARFPGLMHQIFPCFNRQNRLALQLICVKVHIAHPAVKIAQRSQFKIAKHRNPFFSGFQI